VALSRVANLHVRLYQFVQAAFDALADDDTMIAAEARDTGA
jgi:hypothetical protein